MDGCKIFIILITKEEKSYVKQKMLNTILISFFCFSIFACASHRSIRIQEKFEPCYKPNFNYDIPIKKKRDFKYTIGIIETEFIVKKNSRPWTYQSPRAKQYISQFKREVANALEKILISKGCKVYGPFESYEEMTFPERSRCSFLIKPTIILDLSTYKSTYDIMPEVGGPNLQAYAYAGGNVTVKGNVQMEYVILDPLTKEKLERHKLKTKEISLTYFDIVQGYYGKDGKPGYWESLSVFAMKHPELKPVYSQYCNPDNVSAKILEEIFVEFIAKTEKLISTQKSLIN